MLCNNMNNITKKIQTILFAGIIAAMILPFSGMQFAEADKPAGEETDKVLKKIREVKNEARNAISTANTGEDTENENLLYRLNLAEKHRLLQLEGKGDSKKANKIMLKLKQHMDETLRI